MFQEGPSAPSPGFTVLAQRPGPWKWKWKWKCTNGKLRKVTKSTVFATCVSTSRHGPSFETSTWGHHRRTGMTGAIHFSEYTAPLHHPQRRRRHGWCRTHSDFCLQKMKQAKRWGHQTLAVATDPLDMQIYVSAFPGFPHHSHAQKQASTSIPTGRSHNVSAKKKSRDDGHWEGKVSGTEPPTRPKNEQF